MNILEIAMTAFVTSILTSGGVLLTYVSFRRQYLLHVRAEKIARMLLRDNRYNFRTFKTISHHLGGFQANELRKILVQAGGVRFHDDDGIEIWGLYRKVRSFIEAELNTKSN